MGSGLWHSEKVDKTVRFGIIIPKFNGSFPIFHGQTSKFHGSHSNLDRQFSQSGDG